MTTSAAFNQGFAEPTGADHVLRKSLVNAAEALPKPLLRLVRLLRKQP